MADLAEKAALKRAISMLEATLERQLELHRIMLRVAEAKRQCIIRADLAGLEKSVSEENKLVSAIEEEEKKRLAVMPLIQRSAGRPEGAEKLSDLINSLEEGDRGNLPTLREALKTVIEECRRKVRHNAELLKVSLEHMEAFLRTVAEVTHPDSNYTRSGKRDVSGPSLLDRSA
ncbi:MAG: flagellar protein FlgN [Planctomycetota bacterium]|jgi:flagellar biosynthesis/type III secretory pathway chaperone|nr:flagellar protein FlgN [Planctomycetota bacterium]